MKVDVIPPKTVVEDLKIHNKRIEDEAKRKFVEIIITKYKGDRKQNIEF